MKGDPMTEPSYALALVFAWLLDNPEYYSVYVAPYSQLRWFDNGRRPGVQSVHVSGHYRRKAKYANLLPAIRATCKFELLHTPSLLSSPYNVVRVRRDEEGRLLAPNERVFMLT